MSQNKTFLRLIIAVFVVSALSLLVGGAGLDAGIIISLRAPRVLLAVLVGGLLAVSGAVYQSMLKNPLADPYILGSASGAAAGVATAQFLKAVYLAPALSFAFSFATAFFVFAAADGFGRMRRTSQPSSSRLILTGVAVNVFVSGAVIAFYYVGGQDPHSLIMFLFGNLQENNVALIALAAVVAAPCIILLLRAAPALDTFALGQDKSATLGVNVPQSRMTAALLVSVLTAISVSAAGVIGFVGLVAPHVARILAGAPLKRLLPASLAAGAVYLVVSDALARTLFSPIELPVGVVTAVIGAPYFIYILSRTR